MAWDAFEGLTWRRLSVITLLRCSCRLTMGSAWRREGSREEPTQHIASERETAPQNLQRAERGHRRAVQEQLSGSSEDRAAELSSPDPHRRTQSYTTYWEM